MPSSLAVLLPPASGFSPCPPVSVCGTGPRQAIAAFLGGGLPCFATFVSLRFRHALTHRRLTSAARAPCTGFSSPGSRSSAASPHVLSPRGAGIFTCCPSGAPYGLPLGPDFPREDQLYPGNLGHPAWRIRASISLLIPAFSLPAAPPPLAGAASPPRGCSPTGVQCTPHGFGVVFQPRTFSARGLSASELLRTLLTRGCF